MKKLCKIKTGLITVVILAVIGSNLISFAEGSDSKLNPPQFTEETKFIQPVNKPVCLTLKSEDKDSDIYFTTQLYDEIPAIETKYTKPILFEGYKPLTITAVSRKEGYRDSDVIKKTYIRPLAVPSILGVKCNKMEKGTKQVTGSLESLSLEKGNIRVEVVVSLKCANGSRKTYKKMISTGKKGAKWTIKLKKALKRKDNIIINCYSKDCIVRFTRSTENEEAMILLFKNIPHWKRIAKII